MIRYTLVCECGHDFEAWFRSSESYDAQAQGGLVECPACGSAKVAKAMMAPALGKSVAQPENPAAPPPGSPPREPDAGRAQESASPAALPAIADPERQLRALMRAVREHVTKTADDVGGRFPEEARRMHYGETTSRPIYGEASAAEARALIEEGIEVAPLPSLPDEMN